tara:strand:+ start:850 stop:1608 length:759 start_codon:yes stop_codon:yes gene_type:complete
MKYINHIFDVGAFNGLDGLALAIKNKDMMVHAFEANPDMVNVVKSNKKKIEKFLGKTICNFKIKNYAVSDKNIFLKFNIAVNPTVSSLQKFSKNIKRTWPGYAETHCKFIKQIKVKGITLKKYCKLNKINKINYLHIDTQGNDLKVLKGLENLITIVDQGVLEAAINKQKALYQHSNTVSEIRNFLKRKKYYVTKVVSIEKKINNEKNIYFKKNDFKKKYKINTKYNLRFFNRIISNQTNLKDKLYKFFKIY